ncbi:HNH endonuclease [Pseudomonas sp. GD04058]|uniref:HNH endonuclease signature motif containing protein n=1 Tax=Pseudomonas sp. GD04058 TaxID=2975429 RepID=UPI002447F5A3|nr:HNH endonuclease signature motif containing protein [Pseudomonas sp. GD04058]MDG9882466.1 HNH endonuclease [Pseudomonas sp. GD04058]
MISYPRTAGKLAALLKSGYDAVLDQIRQKQVLVNVKEFLRARTRELANTSALQRPNDQLLDWFNARKASGLADAAIVYHPKGACMLHGFTIEAVPYTRKLDRALYASERARFDSVRPAWLKSVALSHRQELLDAGLSAAVVDRMEKDGKVPPGYEVHHRLPLDDGGTNAFSNLILMRNDIEHIAVHGRYNPGEKLIHATAYGDMVTAVMPLPPQGALIYPDPSRQWVSERVPNIQLYEIYK